MKETNAKARAITFNCMSDSLFERVKGLKEAKVVWNKLCLAYKGDPKTKQASLMILKHKYEYLRMLEDENYVENYIHRVTNLTDGIRAIGGHLEECDVVHKILLIFPKFYKP